MKRIGPFSWLQRRLAGRTDSEHVQALMRIVVVIASAILVFHLELQPDLADQIALGHRLVLAAILVSIGIFIAIVLWPAPSFWRRIAAMVHDTTIVSGALLLGESALAPFASLLLVVAVANGFRFGIRFLYISTVMALCGFLVVFVSSDYWRTQTTLSVHVFVMLTLVPVYVGVLLRSLHQARDQLRLQATIDPLTGLLNRAEFEQQLENVLMHQPDGHMLLYCDLDRFKYVNDSAGHAAGDRLLSEVGRLIPAEVRETDLCARPGGDEFCILLLNCEIAQARDIAERIRMQIAAYRLNWRERTYSVGISIGLVPSARAAEMAALCRLADAACYAAKNAGRNRIHVVDENLGFVDTATFRLQQQIS